MYNRTTGRRLIYTCTVSRPHILWRASSERVCTVHCKCKHNHNHGYFYARESVVDRGFSQCYNDGIFSEVLKFKATSQVDCSHACTSCSTTITDVNNTLCCRPWHWFYENYEQSILWPWLSDIRTLLPCCASFVNLLECKCNYSATSNEVGTLAVDGGIWRGRSLSIRPFLAVPNVTAHPSPINGWGFSLVVTRWSRST